MENVRLIDAIALETKAYLTRPATWDDPNGGSYVVKVEDIENAPTIDPESLRPKGRWIMTVYTTTSKRGRVISNKKYVCSECRYSNGRKQSNYCPSCGAKMEV